MNRIYVCGVKPAVGYGAAVNGFNDKELRNCRKVFMADRTPASGGASLTAKLAVHGDPLWKEAVAPALEWHRQVWAADTATVGAQFKSVQEMANDMAYKSFEQAPEGERALVEPLQRLLRAKKMANDPLGKYLAMAFSIKALWTEDRLKEAGYDTDGLCPLCKEVPDSQWHRCWQCKHQDAVEARTKAAPSWAIKEALENPDDTIWNRAVCLNPAVHFPLPLSDAGIEGLKGTSLEFVPSTQWDFAGQFAGREAAWDGSCTRPRIKEMARAAWAATLMGEGGEIIGTIRGPVWDPIPQTAQAAENCALAKRNWWPQDGWIHTATAWE